MKKLKTKLLRRNDIIKTRDGAFYVFDGIVGRKCDPQDKFVMDFMTWDYNGKPTKKFKNDRKDIVAVFRVDCLHYQQQKTEAYRVASGLTTDYDIEVVYTEPTPTPIIPATTPKNKTVETPEIYKPRRPDWAMPTEFIIKFDF